MVKKTAKMTDIEWNGTVIELEFDIEKARILETTQKSSFSELAERLGL